MAYTVLIHLMNEDPIMGEMEELPGPTATNVVCSNVRRRDGKDVHFVTPEATTLIFPWHRISFIEVMPSEAEEAEIIEFFRE